MEEITLDSARAEIEAQVDKVAHKYGYNSIGDIPMFDLEQPEELAWAAALDAAAEMAEIAARQAYFEQLGKSLAGYISLDDYMSDHSSLSIDEAKAKLRKVIRRKLDYIIDNHTLLESAIGGANTGLMQEALIEWDVELY